MLRATCFFLALTALWLAVGVAILRQTPASIGWGLLAFALVLPLMPRRTR